MPLGEVSENTSDKEAPQQVAGENTQREMMYGCPACEFVQSRGETPARKGAKAAAKEDEKGVHESLL